MVNRKCRIRHIKCDEQKPICFKCRSSGVVCDGYNVQKESEAGAKRKDTTAKEVQVDRTYASVVFRGPSNAVLRNGRELRSFSFFQNRTVHDLNRGLPFWGQLVLQISHSDLAVRHAVNALGSLTERLHINSTLTSGNELANSCHDFARLQYYKAVGQLRKRICDDADLSIELALVLCYLFICFEFLQGDDVAALTHLRSGRGLLHRLFPAGAESATNRQPISPPDRERFRYGITIAIGMADITATRWLAQPPRQPEVKVPIDTVEPASIKSESFSSLLEAENSLCRQINRLLFFQRSVAAYDMLDLSDPRRLAAVAQREELIAQLNKWPPAMEVLLKQQGGGISPEDLHHVTLLSVKQKISLIMLTASLQRCKKSVYQRFEPVFQQAVSSAATLLQPYNVMANSSIAAFSSMKNIQGVLPFFNFTEGVIHALYFTTISCCNRSICQKALSLLSLEPWREGAWDSAGIVKIARRKVRELEEKGWYDETNLGRSGAFAMRDMREPVRARMLLCP